MKKTALLVPMPYVPLIVLVTTLVLLDVCIGAPRTETVKMICTHKVENNFSVFVPNFVATMENISTQMRTQGWGVSTIGKGPDANFGLAQCYGDLSLLDCVLCYAEARTVLPQCFPYNGGRIYLDGCFMRAENYSFFPQSLGAEDTYVCGNKTRKDGLFQDTAKRAVLQAVSNAPNNNGYARVELPKPGRHRESAAYVLANCWKTVNASGCRRCLEHAAKSMLKCLPWSEARALYTGCFMRYSDTNFLNSVPSTGTSSSRANLILIVALVVCSAILFVVGVVIGVYIWKQKRLEKKRKGPNDVKKLVKILHDSSLNFKYSTLEKATGSFDEANKLGQGGYGIVYKGVLVDGRDVAVKRLFFNNKHRATDFYNEVNIISQVEHKNLVRLLGCSCSGPESLLVYEFLPNLSLDRFIFDQNRGKGLNWEKRFSIIIGTAEGLVYLHENLNIRIIHRDIKASNILLDSRFQAKIADFGLARSFQDDKSHISTAIAGTLGYMAPEYLANGQLTEKADIYSFGVLLLEIVTGRQNNRSKNTEYADSIVNIAWMHFQEGTAEELFDPNLMLHNYDDVSVKSEVLRVLQVGLLCIQEMPSLRPSMSKVLQMLVKKEEELPPPTNPPFLDEKTMEFKNSWDSPMYRLKNEDFASNASLSHSTFYPR
ncbi:cysteine-rich receptor-like protein kinase 2 [Ipomoea triloba]|uniref:cysteine-rich receptor-like protein kinase 2 n=1 Tax=Ipomoea triloba TaxID=35885 RepID=UPI00125D8E33|nr:cysteine-rich receptor-like protein kinase 2 [Ipomoea triloba]